MKRSLRIKSHLRQSYAAACSEGSGEEASAAAAAPDRRGEDERKHQQRTEGGDRSPSSGEGISVRPKRRRKKIKRRLSDAAQEGTSTPSAQSRAGVVVGEQSAVVLDLPQDEASRRSGNLSQASNRSVDVQGEREASATPATGKKKGKLAGYETRHKRSPPSDPTAESNVGGVEVSCGRKLVWIPKQQLMHLRHSRQPSDQTASNHDGVAQVARESSAAPPMEQEIVGVGNLQPGFDTLSESYHSRPDDDEGVTKPSSGDPGKVIEQDEDEWHSDKIGVHAIEDLKQQLQLKYSGQPSDQTASNRDGDVQVAREASAAPPREEEIIQIESFRPGWSSLKEGCLDDTKQLMDQSVLLASHSSSRSVEAPPEEASSVEEETSTLLKVEKKNKLKPSSSGDLGKIAQIEDEHSDKKPSSEDLSKTIAQDEDEQHSDMLGVHAIEDHKQEQGGRAGECVQSLLDLDDDTISEKTTHYFKQLNFDLPEDNHYWPEYEPDQLTKVNEQLALYRIRGYQLQVDQELDELDDENLKRHYPPTTLYKKGYFQYYEDSLEWYFDPRLCERPDIDDYQRLMLRDNGEYHDLIQCYLTRNTYEEDQAYVKYRAALANELKWVEDCLDHRIHQWKKIKSVAFLQAVKIGAGFPDVSACLVISGFHEHLWSSQFDRYNYKGLDGVYFEIWKRVAKLQMNFRAALLELQEQDMFPLYSSDIKHELENTPERRFLLEDNFDAHVARIGDMVLEGEARQLIKQAVIKMAPKPKTYLDYAMKKLEIAEEIDIISKVRRPERIGPQRREDDSEAKLAMGAGI